MNEQVINSAGCTEGVPGLRLKLVCRVRRESPSGERRKQQLWGKITCPERASWELPSVARALGTEGDITYLGNMEVPEKLS